MCTVMAFLFTSCGKSAAKKDHISSHEIILNSVRVSVDFALRGWQVGLRPNEGNTYDVFLTDFCSVLSI